MSLQDDKFSSEYWEQMVDKGNRFVSAKTMLYYIITIAIIVQSISLLITPSNWLIWNALGFIIATNLGAVILAIKAQHSAEMISQQTSQAFNADFYHTLFLLTAFKNKMEEENENDSQSLKEEIDDLGGDIYQVVKGYIQTYSQHMNTEFEMAESKNIKYENEEELFE